MPKIIRVTTAPIALKYLIHGQMKFMRQHGFEVVAMSADGPERKDVVKQEGCRHIIVPMERAVSPAKDLACLLKMVSIFKKEKPDIVHSHTPKAGLLAMVAAKVAGVPIRIHTVAGLRFRTTVGRQRKMLIAMEKLTFSSCTHLWPNSQSIKDIILKLAPSAEKKISIVGKGSSNGIDLHRFNRSALSVDRINEIKKEIGFDVGNIYFLVVGRIVKDKGVEDIAEAFQRLQASHKNVRLIIIGQFENELDPIDESKKELLMKNPAVRILKFADDIEYYFAIADFLIHASYREGFPNVLLQAGAMKCPIICSEVEGNIDIIRDKETGIIFPPKNSKALVNAIEFALKHRKKVEDMAEKLNAEINIYYERHNYHELLLKKYNSLLS